MIRFLIFFFINILMLSTFIIGTNCLASNNETPSIEVKGQASVFAEPDIFSLTISIVERGQFTDKIRSVVDNKSSQVVQVARSLGIKNHNINSAKVNLRIIEKKPSISLDSLDVGKRVGNSSFKSNQHSKVNTGTNLSKAQKNIQPQYFELSRTININFLNIKTYDQFLNKAIKLGISNIYPLVMSVENTEKYYQDALVQALKNAKNKAIELANHSNVTLGQILYITEQSSNYYRTRVNTARMSASLSSNHNSQVGNQVINASVLVKFAIKE